MARFSVIAGVLGLMLLAAATVQAQTVSPLPSPSPTTGSLPATPVPTPAPSPTVSLPALEVTPADLGVPNPSGWQFFKRRFVRLFTRNEVKRAKLNLELANLTLLRAQRLLTGDNQAAATEALQSYQAQISQVNLTVGELLGRLPQDASVQGLVDQLTQDNLLQVELLVGLEESPAAVFNERVLAVRLEVTKKLADLLTKEDLTPEEFAEKLQKLEVKLFEKEAKAERKLLRHIRFVDDLDEATDDPKLEEGLENRAKAAVRAAARDLAPDQLGGLVRQIPGDQWKHLAVLQAVLDQVPAQTRPALERAIAEELADLAADLRKEGDDTLEEMLDAAKDEEVLEAQADLAKKLAEQLKDDAKRRAKLEEKHRKLGEKQQEAERKLQRRLEEQAREEKGEEDEENDQAKDQPTPTPSPTSTGSGTLSPTAIPTPTETETSRLELEIDIQNFAFSEILSLEKGRKTKIRVRNRDSVSHTLTISGLGVSTGPIKPGNDEDIEFTPLTSGNFKVTCDFHPSMSGSATVN